MYVVDIRHGLEVIVTLIVPTQERAEEEIVSWVSKNPYYEAAGRLSFSGYMEFWPEGV
jgi:hypothetical protein